MALTNTMTTIGIITGIAVVGGLTFYYIKEKRKIKLELNTEIVETQLTLKQLGDYFKSLDLQKTKHTPFIAIGNSPEFTKTIRNRFVLQEKYGYKCIVAGVYEKGCDIISLGKIFYTKHLDKDLIEALGNNPIIIIN